MNAAAKFFRDHSGVRVVNGKPQPAVTHGTCRLVTSDRVSIEECLDYGAGILSIRPDKGGWKDYFVRTIRNERGKVIGYRLETIVGSVEDAAPVYDIDVSFGGINEHTTCECGDYCWRHAKTGVDCKHIRAIRAALQRPNELVTF